MVQSALLCLALNIYHEARGEPTKGQIAVAMVTMNRAEWKARNVCEVVYEPNQFSWTRKRDHTPQEQEAWAKARRIARNVVEREHKDETRGATFFHTTSVKPRWRHAFKRTAKIGNHLFYATR
ncbi:cell wall hydrolase [Pseudomonas fluorescens]|uniref:cell wall hydrolase n=1 Tax=Pseudomonas fluorescens TaxID=294 RepID=UPI001A9E688E|nr:cell wall hydrolase [Pseudomonas fluorescens]QTD31478.1 cell wall hydrolase [Pseudomonas fluorescens]